VTDVLTSEMVLSDLKWLDGSPLWPNIEPYRRKLFAQFLDTFDEQGRPRYNLCLDGRSKKNNKTLDGMLGDLVTVMRDDPRGATCIDVANDEDQAADGLDLAKKLIRVNPMLDHALVIKKNIIERRDGGGYIEILPGRDAIGAHGRSYRRLRIDEIHGQRNWDLLEALAPDPHRPDAQIHITSYASLHHKPGAPLFDLLKLGKAGTDPRMLFSWYAADFTTDPDFANLPPEQRANPSMASWPDQTYLDQQRLRLPAHKFRRLHLNLPGLPEGSAFQVEPIDAAVVRGSVVLPALPGVTRVARVDMSGGSNDDATLAIAWCGPDGIIHVELVVNQGPPPPFDPRPAVAKFAAILKEHGLSRVIGDAYAGETFRKDFEREHITYIVDTRSASDLYEAFEPILNGGRVKLPDVPMLEQQLLGLVWRGSKITHLSNEHDDWALAAVGAVLAAVPSVSAGLPIAIDSGPSYWRLGGDPRAAVGFPEVLDAFSPWRTGR
jgi:hypothetical protein